jgi:Fe-S cluster biogenesis protein NfuA
MQKENYKTMPFEGLDEEILRLLEPLFERYTCPAGTVIFEQGEPALYLYLLLRGSVTLRYKPYDGPALNLAQVSSGGVFGWSAVVGNPEYTSGTLAKKAIEAIRISGADLRALALSHPEAGRVILDKLAGKVSNRWKDANHQVRDILEQAVPTKKRRQKKAAKNMATTNSHSKNEQLKALIERVSAYVEQFHGGSVEFVSLNGNRLTVRLGGACLGCPLSPATLQGWVAGTVHQFFPEIEVVSAE